jgi:hypothetical protein
MDDDATDAAWAQFEQEQHHRRVADEFKAWAIREGLIPENRYDSTARLSSNSPGNEGDRQDRHQQRSH